MFQPKALMLSSYHTMERTEAISRIFTYVFVISFCKYAIYTVYSNKVIELNRCPSQTRTLQWHYGYITCIDFKYFWYGRTQWSNMLVEVSFARTCTHNGMRCAYSLLRGTKTTYRLGSLLLLPFCLLIYSIDSKSWCATHIFSLQLLLEHRASSYTHT